MGERLKYIDSMEMREDIKKLILLVSAFTKKDTVGEDYLNEIKEKYQI